MFDGNGKMLVTNVLKNLYIKTFLCMTISMVQIITDFGDVIHLSIKVNEVK